MPIDKKSNVTSLFKIDLLLERCFRVTMYLEQFLMQY